MGKIRFAHGKQLLLPLLFFSFFPLAAQHLPTYKTAPGDPLRSHAYTLDNGLKVFLTVYKEEPRIQCYIAVRAGTRNDPPEARGMVRSLERLLYNGTPLIGTKNWEEEKPLLEEMERIGEICRAEKNPERKEKLCRQLDSLSWRASQHAIPGEYLRLMELIGARRIESAVYADHSVYVENIPSNQLENWALIQAERFTEPVFRFFYSDLARLREREEKRWSQEDYPAREALLEGLFPEQPCGASYAEEVSDYLRNPSITATRRFFKEYYVPGNMSISLSGDFDFDEAIAIIDNYFGSIPPGKLPPPKKGKPPLPLRGPVVKEWDGEGEGEGEENVRLAFRIDEPATSREIPLLKIMARILSGLLEEGLDNEGVFQGGRQETSVSAYTLAGQSALILYATPRKDQTLEEVREMLEAQVDRIKKGEFEEWLVEAAVNNLKRDRMACLESNALRAGLLYDAFVQGKAWGKGIRAKDPYAGIRKESLVAWARKYCVSDQAVVVYQRQGTPPKVPAPREEGMLPPSSAEEQAHSLFYEKIAADKPVSIAPVFVDFQKDITFLECQGCPLYYVRNRDNQTFTITFRFPCGELHNLKLPTALRFLEQTGTGKHTRKEFRELCDRYACHISTYCGDDYSQITLSGLTANFCHSLQLMMELLSTAQPDEKVLNAIVEDLLRGRRNAKNNPNTVWTALQAYGMYGNGMRESLLTDLQLKNLTSNELLSIIKEWIQYKPEICYYGSDDETALLHHLRENYRSPATFAPLPCKREMDLQPVVDEKLLWLPYPTWRIYSASYFRGISPDTLLLPIITLYNKYMNEKGMGMAYREFMDKEPPPFAVQSYYALPPRKENYAHGHFSIVFQGIKIDSVFQEMKRFLDHFPSSESVFEAARKALLEEIATYRVSRKYMIESYLQNKRMGFNTDRRRLLYHTLEKLTLPDLAKFHQSQIQGHPRLYFLMGDGREVSPEAPWTRIAPVEKITLEDIFAYE